MSQATRSFAHDDTPSFYFQFKIKFDAFCNLESKTEYYKQIAVFDFTMTYTSTAIRDVIIIEPKIFYDDRGYFFESFNLKEFQKHIGTISFVQDNESESCFGVLRGLHFQKPPFAQAKLVRVVKGKALDIAVDIRKSSPTYGQHVAIELSEENKRSVFVPRGFAHGFVALSDHTAFQYKCDNFYEPSSEGGIYWNDPDLNIRWPVSDKDMILSGKDLKHPLLKDFASPFD